MWEIHRDSYAELQLRGRSRFQIKIIMQALVSTAAGDLAGEPTGQTLYTLDFYCG